MSDVLTISVPLGSRYSSVNSIGANSHRAGKKSEAYKQLFADIVDRAKAEIARTGWTMADCECFVTLVRYVQDRRGRDAMNMGKCEFDALTAAGVWVDDRLANPPMPWVRFDEDGTHRLSIVVVKLHQSVNACAQVQEKCAPKARKPVVRSREEMEALNRWKPGEPIPENHALLDGKLVTRAFALEKLGK